MRSSFASALVVGAAVFTLEAQQPVRKPAGPEADQKMRITLDVTRVNILCTVTDRRGRFVTDLTKDEFEVIEDKRPQTILEFSAETELPLKVAIVIDASNSVRERFKFIQEAAIEFINSTLRPQDAFMVVSFDVAAGLVADPSGDPEMLATAIRELRPGGGTALYDALYFACREKLLQNQPRHTFRRSVLILSDGEDYHSRVTRDQALEMAQKVDAVIYAISTNVGRPETYGDKVLKYLASETGGVAFFPFKVRDLSRSFRNIADDLRHQYNILYRPEPLRADGQYHTVDLRVKGRKGLIVRARKGYYAPQL